MTARADRRPLIRLALGRIDVAASLGISPGSVDQMVAEGYLPPPRKWHLRKIWLVADIEAYLSDWPVWPGGVAQVRCDWDDVANTIKPAPKDHNDPLAEHYKRIGFNPLTMTVEDYSRLLAEAEEKWIASIPGTPLRKRERNALAQLAQHGVGVTVDVREVKDCGPDTEDRLAARGYIEVVQHSTFPDRVHGYRLTLAGMKAIAP